MRRHAVALVLVIFMLGAVSAVAGSARGVSRAGLATPQAGSPCDLNLWYGSPGSCLAQPQT